MNVVGLLQNDIFTFHRLDQKREEEKNETYRTCIMWTMMKESGFITGFTIHDLIFK